MRASTAAGGAEAAVIIRTFCGNGSPRRLGRVDEHAHDHGRAAQMGDRLLGERGEDRLARHLAQADLGPGLQDDAPREAPAVAVEHRQSPQIDRELRHAPDEDVADRVQVRAAVVIDHALRVAGGARGVVQRDRLPLVGREDGCCRRIAFGQQRLVLQRCRSARRPGPPGRPRRSPAGRGRQAGRPRASAARTRYR